MFSCVRIVVRGANCSWNLHGSDLTVTHSTVFSCQIGETLQLCTFSISTGRTVVAKLVGLLVGGKMSDYEKLEQVLAELIQCSKVADNETGSDSSTTAPCNEKHTTNTLKMVAQATDKLTESLTILHEFEMLMHDKTASLHVISNELVLNALLLHEQKTELVELRTKLKDISGKWYQSTETVANTLESLYAEINQIE